MNNMTAVIAFLDFPLCSNTYKNTPHNSAHDTKCRTEATRAPENVLFEVPGGIVGRTRGKSRIGTIERPAIREADFSLLTDPYSPHIMLLYRSFLRV